MSTDSPNKKKLTMRVIFTEPNLIRIKIKKTGINNLEILGILERAKEVVLRSMDVDYKTKVKPLEP